MLAHPQTRNTDGTAVPLTGRFALSPSEAAELLGVTRQTIYNLINRGVLTRYKVGRLSKLNAREVLALVGGDTRDAA